MPDGKPAGIRCAQLTDDNRCAIFGHPERPEVCNRLRPSDEMCGSTSEEAYERLALLELATVAKPEELSELFEYLGEGGSGGMVRKG